MSIPLGFLDIGTKIDIIKLESKDRTLYPSQILDIISSKDFVISGPISQGKLVFLHKGDVLRISYNVVDKGNYYFSAKVVSRNLSSIYTLNIKRISEIKKIQLRNYYRLPITLDINKEFLPSNDNGSDKIVEVCELKDISGGGMKIFCNYEHKTGDEIDCSFKIGNSLINARAIVVRIEETNSLNYKYSIGVSFLEIMEDKRDYIIKYIFEQQRILRLKGMI